MRSHQNIHFYKRNRHFFKSNQCLHVSISSKSAGDGGVTTVVLRNPLPGTPPGGGCKGGVRGVNPQRVRIIASFFQFCEILLCWLHCISALSPGKVRRTRSLQKQSLFFVEKRCSPARLFFNPSIETFLFLSFFLESAKFREITSKSSFLQGEQAFLQN